MNDKLLGLLRAQEFIHRDRWERADAANKAAYGAGQTVPHSEQEMVELELNMLRAQIELAREESNTDE